MDSPSIDLVLFFFCRLRQGAVPEHLPAVRQRELLGALQGAAHVHVDDVLGDVLLQRAVAPGLAVGAALLCARNVLGDLAAHRGPLGLARGDVPRGAESVPPKAGCTKRDN